MNSGPGWCDQNLSNICKLAGLPDCLLGCYYLFVCQSVCLACLLACLFVAAGLFICFVGGFSVSLSVCLPACLSVCPSACLSVCLPVCLCLSLSLSLSLSMPVCLFCLFVPSFCLQGKPEKNEKVQEPKRCCDERTHGHL